MINEFELRWYIFSDGEEKTINTIKTAAQSIGYDNIDSSDNIIILENGFDYENMLIFYVPNELLIKVLNEENDNDSEYSTYFESYKRHFNDQSKPKRKPTKEKCQKCKQIIYEDVPQQALDENKILYKCMIKDDGKSKYALPMANEILKQENKELRFPKPILKLLIQLESDLNLKRREIYNDLTII